ncbi:MAG: hypothetical protein WAW80_05390 [Candidatus Saccharimonadales bacterium]
MCSADKITWSPLHTTNDVGTPRGTGAAGVSTVGIADGCAATDSVGAATEVDDVDGVSMAVIGTCGSGE